MSKFIDQNFNNVDIFDVKEILKPINNELIQINQKLIESLSCENEYLNTITSYVINSGGKRLRPALAFLVAKALNNGNLALEHFQIGISLELIHTATLVHDDVIDNSDLRRGQLTVHKRWNDKTAIITGDFLLSRALYCLSSVNNTFITQLFANMLNEICIGEIQQTSETGLFSIDNYIEKSRRKTAMLFETGAESSAMVIPDCNDVKIKAVKDYAMNFGIAFQITDDALNYTVNSENLGKPVETDIANKIITAPVLFALEEYKNKHDLTLEKIINKNYQEDDDLELAVKLVSQSEGILKTKALAKFYSDKAIKCLDVIEDSIYKQSLIQLAYYIIDRNK